ncbi:MAG: 23S rRNA pseudouridine1911/1915/1917 synthase [Polaribacter sp.]|jgi:23S rRNA pseudouridine1911/1915/1917 synthase
MEENDKNIEIEKEGEDQPQVFEHFRLVTDPKQGPIRIDKFIQSKIVNISRNRVQNALKGEHVLVNGKPVKSNYKVRPKDLIVIEMDEPPRTKDELIPQEMDLDIRYEDDHIMVIHKPPGLVVHPGVGVPNGTLVNGLMHYFSTLNLPIKEGNEADRPGLVHRIDKNTSGLLVIAKTAEAMTHLGKQFFDHSIERTYWALVWGEPDELEGTITGNIGRHPSNRTKYYVFVDGDDGKHAITHYKVIEPMYYVSLVECKLETGRTHQIRVHMSHIGHPVFNDDKYGGDKVVKGTVYTKYRRFVENCFDMIPRQALHARSLGFIHPATEEKMYFEAPLPADMENALNKWRNYLSTRKI